MRSIDRPLAGAKTIHVSSEGLPSGVTVQLLPRNGLIVSGLQPEWPPMVRLEPEEKKISASMDGVKWEVRGDMTELWILRALDPRFVLRHAVLEKEEPREGGTKRHRGTIKIPDLKVSKPVGEKTLAAFSEEELSIPIEVEEGVKGLRLIEEFPFSKQRLTLDIIPARGPR